MIREIIKFPDPRLLITSSFVQNISLDIKDLINDMFETMYHYNGVGLAAPQIGENLQIFIIDLQPNGIKEPMVFINPEILGMVGEQTRIEGCLSFPDLWLAIKRPEKVSLSFTDLENIRFEVEFKDLLAVIVSHEYEHCIGKVFIEHLSSLKRKIVEKKLCHY